MHRSYVPGLPGSFKLRALATKRLNLGRLAQVLEPTQEVAGSNSGIGIRFSLQRARHQDHAGRRELRNLKTNFIIHFSPNCEMLLQWVPEPFRRKVSVRLRRSAAGPSLGRRSSACARSTHKLCSLIAHRIRVDTRLRERGFNLTVVVKLFADLRTDQAPMLDFCSRAILMASQNERERDRNSLKQPDVVGNQEAVSMQIPRSRRPSFSDNRACGPAA